MRPAALAGVVDVALAASSRSLPSCSNARAASSHSQERTTEPWFQSSAISLDVERELGLVQHLEALGVGLHHPVLDAVVDHLHVVARRRRPPEVARPAVRRARARRGSAPAARPAPGRRRPSCSSRPRGPRRRRSCRRRRSGCRARRSCARRARSSRPVRVAAVDDRVALVEQPGELLDRLLRSGRRPGP